MRLRQFGRAFYIPQGAHLERGVEGDTAAYAYDRDGVLFALGFWGKSNKPLWHYRFKTAGEMHDKINSLFASFESHKANVKERREQRKAKTCKTPLEVYNKALRGDGWITTAEDAVLVRAALDKHFPGCKFSVRSDSYSGGSSIDVEWTGGPERSAVESVVRRYGMSGFDGMIDLKYSVRLWLAPDGSVSLAHSPGTEGSMGSDPERIGSPNHPQAVLIRGGADWVHCNRHELEKAMA